MDLQYLFTSLEGRINRAKWWFGMLSLAVVSLVLNFLVAGLFGFGVFGAILMIIIMLVLFYPSYAVCAKRFQDLHKPGKTALYGLVPLLIGNFLEAIGVTGPPAEPNAIGWICILVFWGVSLWFLIELGILKGTPGLNHYGGDPLTAIS
jgi:uncharacterized membrane protein YhaH (DUF805 family)